MGAWPWEGSKTRYSTSNTPLFISLLLLCRHRPNGRDGARKQRFGLAVRCALLAQQFVHGLLIDWSSALHFAEEAVDEVRRPLSCW